MAHVLTLELPDEVYTALLKTAEQSGQSLEVVAAQLVETATRELADDPFEKFFGVINIDMPPDWADEHDKYIAAALMRKL